MKFGNVRNIKIPRPKEDKEVPGLGKIFVEFDSPEEAKQARKNLQGRTFSDKTVECSYFDENKFHNNDFQE